MAPRLAWIGAAVLVTASALGLAAPGCGGPPRPASSVQPGFGSAASNVARADYAGSARCEPCHAELYKRFVGSPMHRMTRLAQQTKAAAPFGGEVFEHQGDSVRMEQHDGRRYMRLTSRQRGEELYLVTKVIGGRYREDYAGYEVPGTDAGSALIRAGSEERVLPVSYLLFDESYRYKGYSVMVPERDRLKAGATWSETCIFCHNTTPFLTTMYDELGVPTQKYQGSVSDQLLPDERLWRYRVDDEDALRDAVTAEMRLLGAKDPPEPLDELLPFAVRATRRHFRQDHLVEVGIGCEACHNGSAAHAADPRVLPTFAVQSPLVSVSTPAEAPATEAALINRACARCHTVLFSRYEPTWEGGQRNRDPGGSHINSGEARDFLLGGCQQELSCADCHDPHAEDDRAHLDALGTVAKNPTCTRCHEAYASPGGLAGHTRHAPDSSGSACLSCHMPKKNMGLAYELTRYHRIGSPTDEARIYGDRPIECALCHVDWSVERAVNELERGWGKTFDRGRLARLYPNAAERVIAQTLLHGRAHEQVAAAGSLGQHGAPGDAALVAPLLTHEYPLARYFAQHALEELRDRPLDLDLFAPPEVVRAQVDAWLGDERR